MTVQNDSAALCYFHPCTTFAILWGTSSIGSRIWSEIGVRSAQKMQADPRLPVGARLERAGAGPTSGPSWHPPHFVEERERGEGHARRQGAAWPRATLSYSPKMDSSGSKITV
jgi:hypothetical protein